ncbi:MAG TPA: peptidylprolyl isomerase [Flexilinea sp.]|nr:peptidylprolyl isomerase [Flexilinea sp.]HPS48485.1 peptidylprolyl isomerase [Flexilinea sp.]HQN62925.1 peptidylprolyl isomerase [Flexilinea sp.]
MENKIPAGNNKVVSLAYTLWVDGEPIDSADINNPLVYLHGHDNIIPGLENELNGLFPGEKKTVIVSPEDGYGELMPDSIVELDRSLFPEDYIPALGSVLHLQDESDQVYTAYIQDFNENSVIVDLNHPLAGKELKFDIEIVEVRDASEGELKAGHIHHDCSSCGGCEDGSCE